MHKIMGIKLHVFSSTPVTNRELMTLPGMLIYRIHSTYNLRIINVNVTFSLHSCHRIFLTTPNLSV